MCEEAGLNHRGFVTVRWGVSWTNRCSARGMGYEPAARKSGKASLGGLNRTD